MGDRDERWRQKKQAVEAESGQRRQKTGGGGRKRAVEAENERWRQKTERWRQKTGGGGRRRAVEAEDGWWRQKMGGGGSKQPAVCIAIKLMWKKMKITKNSPGEGITYQ